MKTFIGSALRAASFGIAIAMPLTASHAQYYVVGRYGCLNTLDNSVGGMCDITTYSQISCTDALRAHQQEVAKRGDVCQHCQQSVTDNTKRWDGKPPQFVQDGPCR